MSQELKLATEILQVCLVAGSHLYEGSEAIEKLKYLLHQIVDGTTTLNASSSSLGLQQPECRELYERVQATCERNVHFVHSFADLFFSNSSGPQYLLSAARGRALQQLVDLFIPIPRTCNPEAAAAVLGFMKEVREDLAKRSYPPGYIVGKRWRSILDSMMVVAEYCPTAEHVASLALNKGPFYTEVDAITTKRADALRAYCVKFAPQFSAIKEAHFAFPGTTIEVDGLPCSESLSHIWELIHFLDSKGALPNPAATIIEIGSGYGRFARGFHLMKAAKCYVLVDLPQSLAFAHAFLRVSLPNAKIHIVREGRDVSPDLEERFDFILCPVQNFPLLKLHNVALALNIYSFGEMPQGCVDFLLHHLERNCRPKYLFSANTIFQNRDKLHEACIDPQEPDGALVTLKVGPHFTPVHFEISYSLTTQQNGKAMPRVGGKALLRWTDAEVQDTAKQAALATLELPKSSTLWLLQSFLAALWTSNPKVILDHLDGLKHWFDISGVASIEGFNFDEVGEVRFLKDRLARL